MWYTFANTLYMSKFDLPSNAARELSTSEQKPTTPKRKRPDTADHMPRVIVRKEPGVEENEQRIREQIAQIGKSERIKQAESIIKKAKKFFEKYEGIEGSADQEALLGELQNAREALEEERTEKLTEEGSRNKDLLNKNADLHAELVELIEVASKDSSISSSAYHEVKGKKEEKERATGRVENKKTLEVYQQQKQQEYTKAKWQTSTLAELVHKAYGVDPAEISTLSYWQRTKISAKDLLNGNLISKWRDALQKEDALESEVKSFPKERIGFTFPTEEKVKETQTARAPKQKRDVELGEVIGQQYPEQTGEIELPGAKETAKRMQDAEDLERAEFEAEKKSIAKARKEAIQEAYEEKIKPPAAIFEAGEKARKINEARFEQARPMSIEKAAELLPYASRVWEFANEQIKQHEKDKNAKRALAQLDMADPTDKQNNSATKYVFALARLAEAQESGDANQIAMTQSMLDQLNDALGIDRRNSLIAAALAGKSTSFESKRKADAKGYATAARDRKARF